MPDFKKNSIFKNILIEDINNLGLGVTHIEKMAVFVQDAVCGDICDIKIIKQASSYAVARIEKLVRASEYRTDPLCPMYKRCGGCVYRNVSYEKEVELKRSYVKNAFKKAGLDVTVNPTLCGASEHYRNKVQYPIDKDGNIGYYEQKSHKVVPYTSCLLQKEAFDEIIEFCRDFFAVYKISGYDETTGDGILRHICLRSACDAAGGEISVCVVINSDKMPHEDEFAAQLCEKFKNVASVSININKKNTNVILGERTRTIKGKATISDVLCNVRFDLSPTSFYQVNHGMAQRLYQKAAELAQLRDGDTLCDLFCGVGSVGLSMVSGHSGCKLLGVEINPEAVKNARINAKRAGIDAKFVCGDANTPEIESADVLVLDPPRKGCERSLVEKIAKLRIPRVVYISCNPDTLARDCAVFKECGYDIGDVTPVDLFPRTGHVESVVCLTRGLDVDMRR